MTHEAGIEAAKAYIRNRDDGYSWECFPDALNAYLSASSMVLVPRSLLKDVVRAIKPQQKPCIKGYEDD